MEINKTVSNTIHNQADSIQPTNFTGYFFITRWRAWAPGVKNDDDWHSWLAGDLQPSSDDLPDVSFLPGLLRRRLDRYGRMALHTAWPCIQGIESVQTVFASRHGALNRTVELLSSLAKDETLSPTLFTLSVHNSVAGLLSIARKDREASTAMAAGPDTLILSILEGVTMVHAGARQVLVSYADDSVPSIYKTHVTDPPTHPFAISLLLTAAAGSPIKCHLSGLTVSQPPRCAPEAALIRFLLGNDNRAVFGDQQSWQLERNHAG